MDLVETDILSRYPVRQHRLTRQDYYRMAEAGILTHDDRVELLEGVIVDMSPSGPRHALVIENLTELLAGAFVGRAGIRCQLPVVLDNGSEPEPDLALVRRPWTGYPGDHPMASDVFLLIEVSDSSLNFDLTVKLPLYARAGVPEVWVVDLTTDQVHVHRNPSGLAYESVAKATAPNQLEIEALPGPTIRVENVFA